MNKDLKYHKLLHEKLSKNEIGFGQRILTLEKFNRKIKNFSGNILDVGCGNGYASIYMLKTFPKIKKVFLLENSEEAVQNLIPKALSTYNITKKYEVIKGSFDAYKFKVKFDFIISFGAIHHSTCLFNTVTNLAKYIKDGGYLIISEPSKKDSTPNSDYIKKYKTIEIKEGIKMMNGERNDHFYRETEYKTALVFNSLDIIYSKKSTNHSFIKFADTLCFNYRISKLKKINFFKYLIKKIIKKFFNKKQLKNFNINKPLVDKNVSEIEIYCQKNNVSKVPHLWSRLKS